MAALKKSLIIGVIGTLNKELHVANTRKTKHDVLMADGCDAESDLTVLRLWTSSVAELQQDSHAANLHYVFVNAWITRFTLCM